MGPKTERTGEWDRKRDDRGTGPEQIGPGVGPGRWAGEWDRNKEDRVWDR